MLRMTALLVFSLLGVLAQSGTAQAGKAEFHLNTAVAAPKRLEISGRWIDTKVQVISGSQVTVKADFTVDASGSDDDAKKWAEQEKVTVEQKGEVLEVRQGQKRTQDGHWRTNTKGQLVIGVPAGIPVSINTASGGVELRGDFGAVDLTGTLASGDVDFAGAARSLSLNLASGDVTVKAEKPFQRFSAESASGDIHLMGGAADAHIETASGDVRVENLSGPVDVNAVSGEVTLTWDKFVPGSKVDVEAVSGSVSLHLPAGVSLAGKLETVSGSIEVTLPGPVKTDRREVQLSGKDGTIAVETVSGDIDVKSR